MSGRDPIESPVTLTKKDSSIGSLEKIHSRVETMTPTLKDILHFSDRTPGLPRIPAALIEAQIHLLTYQSANLL
jgi:hypothetical protein